MKYPGPKPLEVLETVNRYKLLQIGLTYQDIKTIDFDKAEALLLLHDEIKSYEEDEMKKSTRGKK